METIGGLVDKLITVDMKMWANQEFLYEIRKMSLSEFKDKYISEDGAKSLWNMLKTACDLNNQRSDLIDEIDETTVNLVKRVVNGEDIDGFICRKHKTY